MKPGSIIILAAILLTLSACVQTQATMLNSTKRPAVAPEDVRVYLAEADVECEYERVAIIHAQGDTSTTNEHQLIKASRARAGKIGANGIIIPSIDEPSTGAKIAGAVLGVSTSRRGETVAIFIYEPCRERPPAAATASTD